MENPLTCHLEDPFSDFSLVSLCPFTSKQHDLDPSPNLRNVESLEAVGALLESMALKNPNKLLEKAMSVEDDIRGEDTLGDLHGVNRENLQGRRPALGRKKARFSLKPSSSQSECLVPSVDINKFSDPEEFFLALEKQENAKIEMRRQGGKALADLDQNVPYAERRRRPGLSRKSASYKHRFSMAPSDDKTFLSSQETLSQDLCSPNPSNLFLQTENTDTIALSLTRELSGPIVAGKESAIDVCDVLQSGQDIDDDSDDIIGMLQERFKPIEINKSCLPDMDSVLQSEFKTVEESLWSQDKMSDLHDVVSAIGKETTIGGNNVERSSDYSSTSPKPPKSPYSSISSLRARLFQHRKEKGQFSAVDIYSALPGKAAFCKDTHDLAAQDIEYFVEDSMKMPNVCSSNTMHIEPGDASGDNDTGETNPNSPVHESECDLVSKDTQGLAALDIESSAKYSVKMPNTSSTNGIHIESGDAAGDNDMRETNPSSPVHENECDLFGKDTQALAAAKFTSSEKKIKGDSDLLGVPSDFTEHMELDVDIVKYDERDVNPQSSLLQKESDTAYTMGTFKERSATLGVFSDGVVEFDHGIGGGQSPKPAEDENENNVLYSKVTHDMGAESCTPSEQIPKDNSTISSFGLYTAPHVETDHEIRANDMQGRVLEDNPSNVFDDVVDPAAEHIQPDERVVAEEIQDCNMENSNHNAEQSTANALEDLEKDKSSSDRDGVPTMGAIGDHDHNRPSTSQNQPLKKSRKAFSKTAQVHPPPPETRAAVARKRSRECIEFSKRKSLAGCGTQWETGVRRSTRIRTRPLEYWKGERQLYGRIHDSVISVIGIKYFSPTKETGVAGLKVNSYVSDEYAELVEQAALH